MDETDVYTIPIIEVDTTYQTYESDFCKLKPGTLVRLKIDFLGDPLNTNPTHWNVNKGQLLLYLGILDTSDNPRANHFIKEADSDEWEFHIFDAMHCWLNGEKVLNVNDFRPMAFEEAMYTSGTSEGEYWQAFFPTALDAVEIVAEPPDQDWFRS